MTTLTAPTTTEPFLTHLDRVPAGPAWLTEIRQRGLARYRQLGLPTIRDEEWRYTRIDAISRGSFEPAPAKPASIVGGAKALDPHDLGLTGPRLVFVNGRFSPELSRIDKLPKGVAVGGLGAAIAANQPVVREHLGQYLDISHDAFGALNLAFLEDGGFVHVPAGVKLDQPVHLLYVSTPGSSAGVCHPHNLLVIETGAKATVVEDYLSLGEDTNFSNAVTELVVGDEADVEHYLIERESERSLNVSTLRIQQGASSKFSSHSVLMGGQLVRNNVHPVLAGQGAWSLLNGLYLVTNQAHVDNHMRVEHVAAHCDSRQFYRGILTDQASSIFSGRIKVHRGAQKTDAKQNSSNLLLSDDAQANTKPQLEIYADDVKCTHGATIGQLDPEGMFYLRSRGIDAVTARGLLIRAFAGESLDRMGHEALRAELEKRFLERLPLGDA
ncbi:MAG: Fe-S cluster assembly protein SufD [Phycisphaeraceae bacterium]|nr:Fe-S cluster assembly protein SufD [Phycisphaeraceae bacterium]